MSKLMNFPNAETAEKDALLRAGLLYYNVYGDGKYRMAQPELEMERFLVRLLAQSETPYSEAEVEEFNISCDTGMDTVMKRANKMIQKRINNE